MTRNLAHEFDEFVDQCYKGLDHESSQYKEMRLTWFSAMFILIEEFKAIGDLPEDLALKAMGMIDNQINVEIQKKMKENREEKA